MKLEDIERPIKPKYLPNILSKKEVGKLLKATGNLKHKTILSLIYSAGLRVGEAITMKPGDIDSQRGLIYIRAAKGQGGKFISKPIKTVKRILQGIPAKNLFVQWTRFREIFEDKHR